MAKDLQMCPFLGKDCVRQRCKLWVAMRGVGPSGEPVDRADCTFAWQPVLFTENTKEVRGYAAAMESFRNIVANHPALKIIATAYGQIASIATKSGVAVISLPDNGKVKTDEVAGQSGKSTL